MQVSEFRCVLWGLGKGYLLLDASYRRLGHADEISFYQYGLLRLDKVHNRAPTMPTWL